MPKFVVDQQDETYVRYFCPGCRSQHAVPAKRWHWNGDVNSPTLTPSVRHFYTGPDGVEITICHYVIKDGRIHYCGDSQHELKNQEMALPDIDDAR